MDKFRIDSHKLIYHPDLVSDWKSGKNIFPVYVEISPSGACNHRCSFCAFDYLEYKPRLIDEKIMLSAIKSMADNGVKSVMYAGEGEPLLHTKTPLFIQHGKECGLDNAITTNATLLDPEVSEKLIPNLKWMRVSYNAGTPETYQEVHQAKKGDFEKVANNIKEAVIIRNENNYEATIGIQSVLLAENKSEIDRIIENAISLNVDYLILKPYVTHKSSLHLNSNGLKYDDMQEIDKVVNKYKDENLDIVFRANAISKLMVTEDKGYKRCMGNPFFCEITSDGNIYVCGPYLGNEKFVYGNLYENSFEEIWESDKRKNVREFLENRLDINECMDNCRLDEINRYLWKLTYPDSHVNFI